MNADQPVSQPLQPEPQDAVRIRVSELSMAEKLRVMWGWYWRGVIVTGVTAVFLMIIVGIAGAAGAVFFGLLKIEKTAFLNYLSFLRFFSFFIGLVFGFISLFFLIRWLTKTRIGNYEFWIVRSEKTRQ